MKTSLLVALVIALCTESGESPRIALALARPPRVRARLWYGRMTRGFCSTNGKSEGSLGSREYSAPREKKPGDVSPPEVGRMLRSWSGGVRHPPPLTHPALGVARCRQLSTLAAALWEEGLGEGYTEMDRERAIFAIKLQIWHPTNYSLIIYFFSLACLLVAITNPHYLNW